MTKTQEILALQFLEAQVRRITDEYDKNPSILKGNSIVKAISHYLEYKHVVYQEYDASVFDADEKTRNATEDESDSDNEYEVEKKEQKANPE